MVAVLAFLSSALEGLGIGLLIPLLGALLANNDFSSDTGPLAMLTRLAEMFEPDIRFRAVAACILAAVMLKGVIQALNGTYIAWIDGRAAHDIRCGLSHRLLELGYPFYLDHDPARLVAIVSTDSWRASDAIRTIFSMAAASVAVIVFGLLLASVSWRLFLFVVVGALLIRATQTVYVHRLGKLSELVTQTNQGLAKRMLQIIDAMHVIRIFGQQEREQQRFGLASEDVRKALYATERASARMPPMLEVMYAALFIGVLLAATAGGMEAPVIITFLVLLHRMQPHLLTLNEGWLGLASLRGSLREVEWLLDPANKPLPPAGSIRFSHLSGPIVFEEVRFSYSNRAEGDRALRDVSFSIPKHRSTALIGRSGAGKSTIANMLCRLLEPTSGRITVAGVDLAHIDPITWRARIGVAGQDIDLVEGSVAENIAYGAPGAAFEDIVRAARLADADSFIGELPNGYRTDVGSRGLSLSAGQRQRIGLARALVRKPEILILDEAINAVDGISEITIMSLLRDRSWDKTTIVISHRQSTLACCEEGIVLEKGRVIESGPLRGLAYYNKMNLATEN